MKSSPCLLLAFVLLAVLLPPSPARPAEVKPRASDIVPASDPRESLKTTTLNKQRLSQHPRLLLTKDSLPKLREFYKSDAGKLWREQFDAYAKASMKPPETPTFLTNATEGQRQGLWRLPTVTLHYLIAGDAASLAAAKGFLELFESLPDWETGKELNSGMSAANIMIGAALAYDWIYDQLDPAFREKFRQTLLWHARAEYYGGHLMKNPGIHYWQNDPANNHRWHRDAGMTLALLSAYTGAPEENWLLNRVGEELAFIAKWLPEDGTSHEGVSYLVFGGNHLTLPMQASDECLGTKFLDLPYFKNVGLFRMGMILPSFNGNLNFGDYGGDGHGGYNNFLLKAASHHKEADVLDGLRKLAAAKPAAFEFSWFSFLWDDPTITGGDYKKLPLNSFFPDVGTAAFRDSWKPDAVSAMFKSCPLGGDELNKFRNEGKNAYINVAHDDPDANSFLLAVGDETLAASDQYSEHKQSSQQNTILVNGAGQFPVGRPNEGGQWSQPGSGDMMKMARIISRSDKDGMQMIEGEAGAAYPAITGGKSRPALHRFRRIFVWVPNKYVLVLDDLQAAGDAEFSWLVQGPGVEKKGDAGTFELTGKKEKCQFQLVADKELKFDIVDSTADKKNASLGYKQLRASASAHTLRIAAAFNPWKQSAFTVKLTPKGAQEAEVIVSGGTTSDRFSWKLAPNETSPSQLVKQAH